MSTSLANIRQEIDSIQKSKRENKKADWWQHSISIIVGLAVVLVFALILYAYLYSDRVYTLKTGEALRIGRSEQTRIAPFIDNV